MHITVEPRENHAILHLRGEFDTYYVPSLQEEVEGLIKAGVSRAVLNLRLVKFINSTALGAIIKAAKQLDAEGGKLVISRPSKFCRDIIAKVGLDRVVGMYDTDEEAAANLGGAPAAATGVTDPFEEDNSAVLFSPVDASRIEYVMTESAKDDQTVNPVHGHEFGSRWSGIGRMSGLSEESLSFTWGGGNTGLDAFRMAQLLALGTEWKIKFRLPLLQRGYCEAVAKVSEVEEREDGVKVEATFSDIDEETRASIRQYAADMSYLKDELRRATDA
ncbi:MAG: anti-sigma factor antagonist [Planctomycetota bacterium]|jgi:anti-anti-sigma factor|nr:anti-sigma factor antagonist [Planctomycetota bacterium]